jgi:predicted transcriptional regulator
VTQALEAFVAEQAWQIEEIKRGVAEADAGDFASAEEVEAVFTKWDNGN